MGHGKALEQPGLGGHADGLTVGADRPIASLTGEGPKDVGEVLTHAQAASAAQPELRTQVEQVEQGQGIARGPFPVEDGT